VRALCRNDTKRNQEWVNFSESKSAIQASQSKIIIQDIVLKTKYPHKSNTNHHSIQSKDHYNRIRITASINQSINLK